MFSSTKLRICKSIIYYITPYLSIIDYGFNPALAKYPVGEASRLQVNTP